VNTGKLYRFSEKQFVTNVNYRLYRHTPSNLYGELVPFESGCVSDGGDYTMELADKRKIRCNLKKRVDRAVIGIPPRYVYHFIGAML